MDQDKHYIPTSASKLFKTDQTHHKSKVQNTLRFELEARIREIQKEYEKQVSKKENQKVQIKHDLLRALIAQQDVPDQETGSKFEETLSKIYNLTFEEFAHEVSKASDESNVIKEDIDTMRSTVDNTAFNQQSYDGEEVIEDETMNLSKEIETDGTLRESYKEKSSEEYTRIVHDISNPSLNYYQSLEGDIEEEYEDEENQIEYQEEDLQEDADEVLDQLGEDNEDVSYNTESNESGSVENSIRVHVSDAEEYSHDQSFESNSNYDTLSNPTSNRHSQVFEVGRSLNSDALTSTAHFNKPPSSIPPQETTVIPHTIVTKSHENFFTFGENRLKEQIPSEISPRPSTQGVSELASSSEPEETVEEEKSSHLLIIEYDSAQTKNKKLQAQHQKILKRDEELAKRHQDLQIIRDSPTIQAPKKRESPLVPRIKEAKKISNTIPKEPMKQADKSPFLKQDVQEPPKEEIKSQLDHKYRRHKNLPNLVYQKHSNKNLIKNAICQVCLAGEPNKKHREELVEVILNNPEVSYFVILFKGELTRWDLQGLYEHDVSSEILKKIHGKGSAPEVITPGMVQVYYRYNSGTKEFKPLACKTITTTVDAVSLKTLHKH